MAIYYSIYFILIYFNFSKGFDSTPASFSSPGKPRGACIPTGRGWNGTDAALPGALSSGAVSFGQSSTRCHTPRGRLELPAWKPPDGCQLHGNSPSIRWGTAGDWDLQLQGTLQPGLLHQTSLGGES